MSRIKTFYEFFAGGGMARLGLGDAWSCTFANDFDPVKVATYRDNFPDAEAHLREGDVWKLSARDLPGQADLAWASSPCQDFSLAGSRAGLTGGRSSAFFGFWQLVKTLNAQGRAPQTIVVENVVGLLTSHNGADFEALCTALVGEGYSIGALEIDAARFVPQSRPRVFVVATRKSPPARLTQVEPTAPFHSHRVVSCFERLTPALKSKWIWWHLRYPPAGNSTIDGVLDDDNTAQWFPEEKAARLVALLGPRHVEKLALVKRRNLRTVGTLFRRMRVEEKQKVQRAELRFDGIAGCLRTPGGGSSRQFVVVVSGDEVRIRAMSPNEAARLMGLSEDYKLPPRSTSALKVLGDGVVVPVVEFLRDNLLNELAVQLGNEGHGEEPERQVANSRRS